MSGREYHAELAPGHKDLFDWIKPHKPVPDWRKSLPPVEFSVPRWDRSGSEEGACPIVNKSDRPGRWRLRVNPYGFGVGPAWRPKSRSGGGNTGIRRSMAGSLSRLAWATHVLEHHGVKPTHMITLTLPPEAWERVIEAEGEDLAVQKFLEARARFLDALRRRLRRGGLQGSWLWFLEFQRRGAPHIHLLLDLGVDRLPDEEYQDWVRWVESEWSRALGVPAPYATRIERLKAADFRYARKYATKPRQKTFPFPARWGRSWDTAGSWRELLRESRYAPTSTYEFSSEELWRVLRSFYEALAYQVPVLQVALTLRSIVEGVPGPEVYRGRLALPPHWTTLLLIVLSEGPEAVPHYDTS